MYFVDREVRRDEEEPAFFYHSDHLGSAAYLTCQGNVIQTLNYLPCGEDWVEYNFFHSDDTTRLGIYRFNGKEKDYESGFHYYGARYYWSEVLTGWLSVDPQTDDFTNITAYNYCEYNPIILQDPDGELPGLSNLIGAIAGAAVDLGGQIASDMIFGDKTFSEAWGNVNWTSVGISTIEGAVTSGGSVVKQVVKTTAKNTFVKAASQTAVKKAAQVAQGKAAAKGISAAARVFSDTREGKGSLTENIVSEVSSVAFGHGASKDIKGMKGPKLYTNNAAMSHARSQNGGHISQKEASKVYQNNRTNNQNKVDRSVRNRNMATQATSATGAVGARLGQSAYQNRNKE